MLANFETLVHGIILDPQSSYRTIDVVAADEREAIERWGEGRAAPVTITALAAIEAQVKRAPDAAAVIEGARVYTYAELDHAAMRVAGALRAKMPAVKRVALAAEDSFAYVAGALGIWKAGAAFVLLDPSYPPARLMTDSGADLLLAPQRHAAFGADTEFYIDLDAAMQQDAYATSIDAPALPDDAYVIYTSGSSRTPKAVVVQHDALANFVNASSG